MSQNQGIRIFANGKNNNLAILTGIKNSNTSSVACLTCTEEGYKITKEYYCKDEEELWNSVRQVIGIEVPGNYRSVRNFLMSEVSGQ